MHTNLMIVILNMSLKDDTLACIRSLIRSGARPEQVIVVDNASTDGSVEAIRAEFNDAVHQIVNTENMGFAAANNQGFELAEKLGAEWALVLNNDTEVDEGFFAAFDRALDANPGYKILTPAIFFHSEPDVLWHLGSRAIPGTLLAKNTYLGKKMPPGLPEILPVDYVSGCAIFIHREVYQRIGLFDPQFFIYWEEVDFCQRAHKAGYHMAVLTGSIMWHKVSRTMRRDKPRTRYLTTRNMNFYTRKHARGLQWPVMIAYLSARLATTLIKDLLRRETYLIPPMLRGWRDGWRETLQNPGASRPAATAR